MGYTYLTIFTCTLDRLTPQTACSTQREREYRQIQPLRTAESKTREYSGLAVKLWELNISAGYILRSVQLLVLLNVSNFSSVLFYCLADVIFFSNEEILLTCMEMWTCKGMPLYLLLWFIVLPIKVSVTVQVCHLFISVSCIWDTCFVYLAVFDGIWFLLL